MVAVERGVAHMMELVFEDITFFERLDLQNGMAYSASLFSTLPNFIVVSVIVSQKSKVPSPLKTIIPVSPMLADFNDLC